MMGHEPLAKAIDQGAQVILAGRASDTSLFSTVPLMRGAGAGPAWHAAKILECDGDWFRESNRERPNWLSAQPGVEFWSLGQRRNLSSTGS